MRKLILSFILVLAVGLLVYITVLSNTYQPQIKISPTKVKSTSTFEHLFEHENFRQIKIVMNQEEWTGMSQDMEDFSRLDYRMRLASYRKADIYYTDNYGEIVVKDVGIRTKGNTTRVLPEKDGVLNQFHFKIKFNETFDEVKGTDTYIALNNRDFADLNELNFKYNNGADQSFMHEIFAFDLFNEVGVHTSKTSLAFVKFVIDGVEYDYGVYSIAEPIDKNFLTKRFGKERDDGNLYKCLWQDFGPASLETLSGGRVIGLKNSKINYRPNYDLKTNKSKADHKVLVDFISNINRLEADAFKEYMDENFDIDLFLRYQAMGILYGNPDDYWGMGNNYYLYFNNDGKIAFIPTDYDHSFGSGWSGEPATDYEGLVNADIYNYISIDSVLFSQEVSKPLVEKILSIKSYRETYEDYLELFIDSSNNYFTYSKFEETFNTLKSVYGDHTSNYFKKVVNMKILNEESYFQQKIESVSTQLDEGKHDE